MTEYTFGEKVSQIYTVYRHLFCLTVFVSDCKMIERTFETHIFHALL